MNSAAQEVRIRRMTADDLGRVMEIAVGLKDATHWTRTVWLEALAGDGAPRRVLLVAEEAGRATGFAVARVLAPQAELESIAVTAERQGRGVGRWLFAALLTEIEPEGITEVLLEVRASNREAIGFYQAQGFEETGRRPRYYADPVEDAVLLSLRLG
jgi:ribosomal-protein-alanine N-acetyltransferase